MKYNCTQNTDTQEKGEIPTNNFTTLCELFDYFENNLKEISLNNDLKNILPKIHTKLIVEAEKSTSEVNLLVSLNKLLQQCEQETKDLNENIAYEFVLQIIYQILTTLQMLMKFMDENNMMKLNVHNQIMAKLIENMFEEKRIYTNDIEKHNHFLAKELACLQLYLELYTKEQNFIIKLLWSKLNEYCHTTHYWQVLVSLFDYFANNIDDMLINEQFYAKLQELLLTDQKNAPKSALYLMRKLLSNWQKTIFHKTSSIINDTNWLDYIIIMENLMESENHLILPALSKLEEITKVLDSTVDHDGDQQSLTNWLNILYKVLLMHKNVMVKRRSIEFLLKNTEWHKLDKEVQELLLNALNSMDLYNVDDYFLSEIDFKNFFNVYNRELWETVRKINWKSVPLHYFLRNSAKCLEPVSDDLDVFMQLTKCVRKLQNVIICKECMDEVLEKFGSFQKLNLSLKEFCQVIEALGRNIDDFPDNFLHFHMERIMKMCRAENESVEFGLKDFNYFSQHFYDTVNAWEKFKGTNYRLQLLCLLREIPKKHHGYMCFYLIFCQLDGDLTKTEEEKTIIKELCPCLEDLTKATTNWTNIKEVQRIFQSFLQFELTEDDIAYVNKLAIDYFILSRIHNLIDLFHTKLDFDVFLELINENTMDRLLEIIKDYCNKYQTFNDAELLKKMASKVKVISFGQEEILREILRNNTYVDTKLFDHLTAKNWRWCNEFINVNNFIENVLPEYANKVGDDRIEYRYILSILNILQPYCYLYGFVCRIKPEEMSELQTKLLQLNQNLYVKKSTYYPNSPEHILQTRIAFCLMFLTFEKNYRNWDDNMWHPILQQNNQCNVTIMYECIIASTIKTIAEIREKFENIQNYKSSQRVSLMSIAFLWQSLHYRENNLKVIIDMLLPLTMDAEYSTRQYAQLLIYKLLAPLNEDEECEHFAKVRKSIVLALGKERISKLQHDVRIRLAAELVTNKCCLTYDIINSKANGPFGEYFTTYEKEYEFSKNLFARNLLNEAEVSKENCNITTNMARSELNDSNAVLKPNQQNLLTPHNFLAFPTFFK